MNLYEIAKRYLESKAFVTAGSLGSFTMGVFLFGGGEHIQLIEYAVKLVATAITGLFSGMAGQLGKNIIDHIKNKKREKKQRINRDNKAA